MQGFTMIDLAVLVVYLVAVLVAGLFFAKKEMKGKEYFKGDGTIPWWVTSVSIFATLLIVVPFLGPFLGTIPAIISGLLINPLTALKVLILLIIVQQIEGHLITPQVMGKRLDIHPLTVILLLLVSGSLYGFIGILIAIPTYSVVKVIIQNFIKFYKLRSSEGS